MSHILTRNAHARNLANVESPTPRNGHAASQIRGRGAAPIPFSSQRIFHPTDPSELSDPPERDERPITPIGNFADPFAQGQGNPPYRGGPGDPEGPDGDPNPPGDGFQGDPNDGDEDGRNANELNANLTVRDLLRYIGPILAANHRGPPPAAPLAPTNPRRLKVNSPEEFDGHSPKKLKSFLVACNNAFRADPDTFRLQDKRVSYALSYLRGSAQRHFDTQLEDEEEPGFMPPDWLTDWTRFVEELRDMFGDPNAETTAEAELDSLRMRTNQKFADFLVEFNTLSSQVNWGDRALRHRLKHALPDRIKDSLALVQEPDPFADWKRLVQSIDQRYWERQADIRRETRPSNTNRGTSIGNQRTPAQGPPSSSATTFPRDAPNGPPVARHLTAQGGLTQTERDRRIAQGLCLYCGGQGHKATECSKARKAREKTGRAAQTSESISSPSVSSITPVDPKATVIPEN